MRPRGCCLRAVLRTAAGDLRESGFVPLRGGVIEQWFQALALARGHLRVRSVRNAQAGEFRERFVQVHEFHRSGTDLAVPLRSRVVNDERHPARVLEQAHLLPQPMFAEVVAVVADEHHDRLVRELQPFEGVEDAADLCVHERG